MERDHFRGTINFHFSRRLYYIKSKLKEWNASHFKNIFVEKARIKEKVEKLNEKTISFGMGATEFKEDKVLKVVLSELLAREELYWRDKARESWLKEGDLNTSFFHALVKARRSLNMIDKIKNNRGEWCLDSELIGERAIRFFKSVMCNEEVCDRSLMSKVLDGISKLVSDEDNEMLSGKFSQEEVKNALFKLHPNKALGPDGFPASFFQHCWMFMGEDIFRLMEDIWLHNKFVKNLNNTIVVLIPKKMECMST